MHVSHCETVFVVMLLFRNIVCTVNLGCKLDLKKIALHARNAEYNPKRFAAVIMRIRDPRTTALIFSSGKMVCTGAKRHVCLLAALFFKVYNHIHIFHCALRMCPTFGIP